MLLAAPDPGWFDAFAALRTRLLAALGAVAGEVHHVGSTAVPGLPAKPILDVDVEIADETPLELVTERLAGLGYAPEGDKGIADRHAYREVGAPVAGVRAHHLYVCPTRSAELARHLRFRDRLNGDAVLRERYAALKARCLAESGGNRAAYVAAKARLGADFFAEALAEPPDLAGLRVRRMRAADVPVLAAAFADMNKSEAHFARYWAENESGARHTLVAEVGPRLVGSTNLVWTPSYAPFAAAGIPEINDMNTVTPLRQRGIGTRLIAAAEAAARAEGHQVLGIGVGLTPDYGIAQRLYPKLGYRSDGRGVRPDAHGGCLYATKNLREAPAL